MPYAIVLLVFVVASFVAGAVYGRKAAEKARTEVEKFAEELRKHL